MRIKIMPLPSTIQMGQKKTDNKCSSIHNVFWPK